MDFDALWLSHLYGERAGFVVGTYVGTTPLDIDLTCCFHDVGISKSGLKQIRDSPFALEPTNLTNASAPFIPKAADEWLSYSRRRNLKDALGARAQGKNARAKPGKAARRP